MKTLTSKSKLNLIICFYLGLAALAGGVYAALSPAQSLSHWYSMDDAFYYYKVAQNVWEGHNFTFDGVNLTNGYHPLWMAVCLCVFWLAKFSLMLPLRVLAVISAGFNALSSVFLYLMLKDRIHKAAAVLSAAFLGLSPYLYSITVVSGMESSISRCFIVLFLLLAVRFLTRPEIKPGVNRELFWLGLVGVFTIFARLDNVFLVGVIGFTLLLRVKSIPRRLALDVLALFTAVFAAWIIRLGRYDVLMKTYSIYPMLLVAVLVKPAVFYFCGLYTSVKEKTRFLSVLRVAAASLLALVLETLILYSLYRLKITLMFSTSLIALEGLLSFLFVLLARGFAGFAGQATPSHPWKRLTDWVKENASRVLLGGFSFAAPIALLLGAYMLLNQLFFGTFMPISGQVKSWWGSLPNVIYAQPKDLLVVLGLNSDGPWGLVTAPLQSLAASLGGSLPEIVVNLIFLGIVALVFIGLAWVLSAQKGRLGQKAVDLLLPSIFIAYLFHIAKYTATSYAGARDWYWIGETVLLVLLGSLILDAFFTWLERWPIKVKLAWPIAALLLADLVFHHASYINRLAPSKVAAGHELDFLAEIRVLETYTEPGSRIGMTGSGFVGYFIQDRTVVNLDGLINSEAYFEALKSGTADVFLDQLGLDYVYGKRYTLLESDPYNIIFKDRLGEVGFIRGAENFTLYTYGMKQDNSSDD